MSSVGKISLDLNVNDKEFKKQVDGIEKTTTKAFNLMSVAVGNIIADMAQRAINGIGNFVKDSINKGSELSELQNVVDSVFTTMADKVEDFSESALESYGLAEAQAKRMMGTYGAMSKSFGYTESQAYSMSAALTALTGDVASFYNLDHDVAYTKMKSVFTGETESLKELGVVMTQSALDQFALANGFGKTTKSMSEQEKVALRLAFVQNKLAVSSGDFMRTQDQWANQTRILSGQFDSLKAALGSGMINVLTPVIKTINTIMAKLVQLAQAFQSFTAMVMGVKSGGGPGSAMMEVADAADAASSATGGVEKAASGAAGAAKEAKKALMGFDEINKLADNSSSSGGAGGGGASFGNMDLGGGFVAQEAQADSALGKVKTEVESLLTLFKEGFKEGLGDDFEASLSRIKGHLSGIKVSVKGIFTNVDVTSAAKSLMDSFALNLGKLAGSLTSVGVTIGEGLIGGLDSYLSQNEGFIIARVEGLLTSIGEAFNSVGDFSTAFASVFEVFRGDAAQQIVADIMAIFTNAGLSILQLTGQLASSLLMIVTTPFIENQEAIKETIANVLAPVSELLGVFAEGVRTTFENVLIMYDERLRPAFEMIAEGFSNLLMSLLETFNEFIIPIIELLAAKLKEAWETAIQPLINAAIELIGKVGTAASALWKTVLVPIITWAVDTIVPMLTPIFEYIVTTVLNLVKTISTVARGIIEVIGGLLDVISGVLMGDWSLCWEGFKSIFKGFFTVIEGTLNTLKVVFVSVFSGIWTSIKVIINAILGGIEGLVNGVIGGLNLMINALNSLHFSVPSWVPVIGGASFGFNLGSLSYVDLPRLAEGGYVRANQPQPVIIGDNKTQGEIVSPEGKMMEVMTKALEAFFGKLKDAGYSTSNSGEMGDIVIPIYLDGTMLDEVIVTAQQRRSIRSGGR